MSVNIEGAWVLVSWRRLIGDQTIIYPLGEDATGLLIYTPDLKMAVQMVSANRPHIDSSDALGGCVEERATAYSTCLAYFGSYDVQDDVVHHRIDGSLYPNWSGDLQTRPLAFEGDVLVLRTPPGTTPDGQTVVNEIRWARQNSTARS